jgi:hypothetical protein
MKRRSVMQLIGGAGAALAAPAIVGHAARAATAFDPKNLDHLSMAHRKLVYSADGAVTFTWLRAMRYALIDSAFTPLWELHSGIMFRTVDKPDGTYEVHAISAIYYTDIETEKFIETFKNPFTGETVTFLYARPEAPKPAVRVTHFGKTGPMGEEGASPAGMKRAVEHRKIGPAWAVGDQIWLRADSVSRFEPTEPGKRMSQVNDWLTYSGSLSAVMDPAVKNPPATQAFNDINTFPAWFGMGERPGNYVSRGFGAKVFAFDDMPKIWRDIFTAKNPQIAKDPKAALGA